jgi:hypothetical protein
VPQFDFTNLNFVASMAHDPESNEYSYLASYLYGSPSAAVEQIAGAVLSRGQMLNIPNELGVNSSYDMTFNGPALACEEVTGQQRKETWRNVWNSYGQLYGGQGPGAYWTWLYLAWVPWPGGGPDAHLPFNNTRATNDTLFSPGTMNFDQPATFYIATLPDMATVGLQRALGGYCDYSVLNSTDQMDQHLTGCFDYFTPNYFFGNATLTQCRLLNTTYTAHFEYTNGVQDISVTRNTTELAHEVTATTKVWANNNPYPNPADGQVCVRLLDDKSCSTTAQGTADNCPCVVDEVVPRKLAYQSIATAFNALLRGSIGIPLTAELVVNSTVLKTVFAQTEELGFLLNYIAVSGEFYSAAATQPDLQSILRGSPAPETLGISAAMANGTRGKLAATMEQAFENLTLSLLAEPYLQYISAP